MFGIGCKLCERLYFFNYGIPFTAKLYLNCMYLPYTALLETLHHTVNTSLLCLSGNIFEGAATFWGIVTFGGAVTFGEALLSGGPLLSEF